MRSYVFVILKLLKLVPLTFIFCTFLYSKSIYLCTKSKYMQRETLDGDFNHT